MIMTNKMASADIFADPIATRPPPAVIGQRPDHPAPRLGIASKAPHQTNKFYANFFLGSQTAPTYLHPYAVSWAKGGGVAASWGIAISHVEASQRVYGAEGPSGAAAYFINPVGIQSLCLSAVELGNTTALTTDRLMASSVLVSLQVKPGGAPLVQFPLVQGQGFVTAKYNAATPLIQTGVFFRTVTKASKQPKPGFVKYKMLLEDGHTWLLYAQATKGDPLDLQVVSNGIARAKGPFTGIIQVAKDPVGGGGEAMYDQTCGAYPTDVALSGTTQGMRGTYTFAFQKAGLANTNLLMFGLPHHVS